jgi:hypothetical protein
MLEKRLGADAVNIKALLLGSVDIVCQVFVAFAVIGKNGGGQEGAELFPVKVGPVTPPHRNLFCGLQDKGTGTSFAVKEPELSGLRHGGDFALGYAPACHSFEQARRRSPA